jgi:signal transduction histidine kinase/DNA-binding response OmpR family regulator
MLDLSKPEFAQISCRNSSGKISYIREYYGEQALTQLFSGILESQALISSKYQYLGSPLTLDYFNNVNNWYSNEINLTLFDNLTRMGINAQQTGRHSISSAKKTHNISTIAYLQMLGPVGVIKKINTVNRLYNRTKTVELLEFSNNSGKILINYHEGCRHNSQVTNQNIGVYKAVLESIGLKEVKCIVEQDDFLEHNNTVITFSWLITSRLKQLQWLLGKLIVKAFCKTYVLSENIIQEYHSSLLDSFEHEIYEKEKQQKKSESYYQQMIDQQEKKEAELTKLVEEKTSALEQSINDKEQLFERFSHELKTPLTLIIGPIEQLLKQKLSLPLEQKLLGINKNAHRLFELVNSLLSLAEINVQREKKVACHICSASQYIISSLQPLAKAKDSKLSLSLKCDEHLTLQLQIQTWELLLTNLITNAIKYGNSHNKITVLVQQNNEALKLTVTDNNQALTKAEQGYIFNRFTTVNPNESSHGLGLSIVKELVDNHHGEINLSTTEKGNVFTVYLPLTLSINAEENNLSVTIAGNMEQFMKPQSELIKSPYVNIKPKVLLVEDNLELADFLKSSFSEYFELCHRVNGRDALLILEKQLFDIIISDVMMPVMDGFEFCQQVKNNDTLQHIPLILLTAKADISSQKQGLALQADDYIGKPFNIDILLQKIHNIISTSKAQAEKIKQHLLGNQLISNTENAIAQPKELFLQQLQHCLTEHHHNPKLKAIDIAELLHTTEKTLNRKLQAQVDVTISELLKEYRLNKAKKLLEQGHQSKTVCFDCGFSSASYFGQKFKQKFGVTPAAFQQTYQAS